MESLILRANAAETKKLRERDGDLARHMAAGGVVKVAVRVSVSQMQEAAGISNAVNVT